MSNIALFDLDGTLADFDTAMRDHMRALAAPGEPEWNPDSEEAEPPHIKNRRRMIKAIPGFWRNLEPMNDGFELFRIAKNLGFRIMILSRGPHQNPLAWMEKMQWCRNNLPNDIEVTLTEDKGLTYGRMLIDDWPPYIIAWLSHRPRGLVIMPDRPWNKDFTHPQVVRYTHGTTDKMEISRIMLEQMKPNLEG